MLIVDAVFTVIITLTREGRDFFWWIVFGDAVFRGRRVTFVDGLEEVVQARAAIRTLHNGERVMLVRFEHSGSPRTNSLRVNEHGITWCYGWSGRDVDALRAQAALIRSAA